MTAGLQGENPLSLQWFQDGKEIDGATNRSLTISNAGAADAGSYSLVAANAVGSATNQPVTVSVLLTPFIAGDRGFKNVPTGGNVCLAPEVLGAAPISFQWQFNGADLTDNSRTTGTHSNQLCVQNATSADSGMYSLIASNGNGSVTQVVAQVAVVDVIGWGDDALQQTDVPEGVTNLVSVVAAGDHSIALRKDGAVLGWGDDSSGQTTIPSSVTNALAIAAGLSHSVALRNDGAILAWGDNTFGQTNVPAFSTNVTALAAGANHTAALLAGGTLSVWGANNANQTNVPAFAGPVTAVAAGGDQTVALLANGTVVAWGGPAANGTSAFSNIVGVAAGAGHALALVDDGTVVAWGNNYYGQASVPASVSNAVAIAAGDDNSIAVLANGTLVAWGADYSGQSSPPALPRAFAGAAGRAHSLALLGAGLPAAPPVFQLLSPGLSFGNGAFRLRLSNLTGRGPLVIFGSTNFTDWQPLYTNAPVVGVLDFIDSSVSNIPGRVYRAAEQR
jgi:hypothetical protein